MQVDIDELYDDESSLEPADTDVEEFDEAPTFTPNPDLVGTTPVFADDGEDAEGDDADDAEGEEDGEDRSGDFYQKGKAPTYGALAAELRHKNREVGALQSQVGQLTQMMQQFMEAQNAPEPEDDDPMPDKDEDPAGYAAWHTRQLEAKIDQQMQNQKETQEERQFRETMQAADEQIHSYRASVGDNVYSEAIDWLVTTTRQEMARLNPGATAAQIETELNRGIAKQKVDAQRAGMNPAQMWMETAVGRGWRPGTHWAQNAQEEGGKAKTGKKKKKDPRKQVRKQRDRSKKARSVGSMEGGGAGVPRSVRRNLELDEDNWNEATKGQSLRDQLSGKGRGSAGQ